MDLIAAIILILLFFQIQFEWFKRHWDQELYVKFSFSKTEAPYGSCVSLIEEIHNNKILPLPTLHVKTKTHHSFHFENEELVTGNDYYYRDDLFTLFMHEKLTRTLSFTCSKRGCYGMKEADLISNDLFFRKSLIKRIPIDTTLFVYPKEISWNTLPPTLLQNLGDAVCKKYYLEDPFLFSGLREYTPNDEFKKINHKISAKQQQLYVNTYESTCSEQILIALNVTPFYIQQSETVVEQSISLAYSIAAHYMEQGIAVGLLTNGKDYFHKEPTTLSFGQTKEHLHEILLALTRIDLHQSPCDFLSILTSRTKKEEGKYHHIIMISNDRTEVIQNFYCNLKKKNKPISWILPEYNDVPVSCTENIPERITWGVNKYDN